MALTMTDLTQKPLKDILGEMDVAEVKMHPDSNNVVQAIEVKYVPKKEDSDEKKRNAFS